MTDSLQSRFFQPKKVPISYDYRLSSNVLGLGINGKVVECYSKADGQKYALKVVMVKPVLSFHFDSSLKLIVMKLDFDTC